MKDCAKYAGIIPAFYACYGKDGQINPDGVRAMARYLKDKGVKGLYVGGSSGECIYQGVAEISPSSPTWPATTPRTAGSWPPTPSL